MHADHLSADAACYIASLLSLANVIQVVVAQLWKSERYCQGRACVAERCIVQLTIGINQIFSMACVPCILSLCSILYNFSGLWKLTLMDVCCVCPELMGECDYHDTALTLELGKSSLFHWPDASPLQQCMHSRSTLWQLIQPRDKEKQRHAERQTETDR